MLKKTFSFKLTQLALLSSVFYISSAWANQSQDIVKSISENVEAAQSLTTEVGANMAQLEAQYRAEAERQAELERQAEEARVAAEKQQQAELKIQEIVGQNELQFKSTVAKIYVDNNYQKLWTDQAAEKQFLREYAAVVVSGISRKAPKILEEISRAEVDSLAYDVLLTDAFLDYMYYSRNILKFAQQWLYAANTYRAKSPAETDIVAWLNAVQSGEALQFVKSLSSDNPLYLQTLARLAQTLPKDGKVQPVQYEEVTVVETVPDTSSATKGASAGLTTTLYPGDVSQEVILLIRALKKRGYLKNHIDGQYYSQGVLAAVKQFQAKHGLKADGVVGANTRALLNGQGKPQKKVTKVKKVAKTQGSGTSVAQLYKLAINTQRLRVIPDFNDGIFVNIPSYQLQYYRDGQLVLQSRVIVGKNARRTPVMYSELSNVVVNPPWNTPTRLVNEDIIPRARKDPSYLERRGYTVLDKQGRAINPNTLDWSKIDPKKFPYRLRQRPGDSALGNYKFNMPSSDAIFLHDTPSRGLFNRTDRALSSGCVRVEKSDELATILLKEAGWSEARKNKVLASKKTTSAPVRSHNPVYLYYVTAWVDNGRLHTLPDIYKYDVTPNLSQINWQTISKYLL